MIATMQLIRMYRACSGKIDFDTVVDTDLSFLTKETRLCGLVKNTEIPIVAEMTTL